MRDRATLHLAELTEKGQDVMDDLTHNWTIPANHLVNSLQTYLAGGDFSQPFDLVGLHTKPSPRKSRKGPVDVYPGLAYQAGLFFAPDQVDAMRTCDCRVLLSTLPSNLSNLLRLGKPSCVYTDASASGWPGGGPAYAALLAAS